MAGEPGIGPIGIDDLGDRAECSFDPGRCHRFAHQVRLDDWERFVNDRSTALPVVAQCALMHDQFEAILPVLDGNGRVGRLHIVLVLIVRGRLTQPVLHVSPLP